MKDETVKSLTFCPSGNGVVVICKTKALDNGAPESKLQRKVSAFVMDLITEKRSASFNTGYDRLAISPDCQLLAAGSTVWDIATGKKKRDLALPSGLVYNLHFSPDGSTLAYRICESLAQEASVLVLMDVATGKKILQIGDMNPESDQFLARSPLTVSSDGKTCAYAVHDKGLICIRDVIAAKNAKWIIEATNEHLVGFSSDSRMLFSWNKNAKTLRLWETVSGKERKRIMIGNVDRMEVSPNGMAAALVSGSTIRFIRVWD
jgi:WD40 repeat protein